MTNEQEALRDLTTGLGWELFEKHALEELQARMGRVLANAGSQDSVLAGLELQRHVAVVDAVRALLLWPRKRAEDLEQRIEKQERRLN